MQSKHVLLIFGLLLIGRSLYSTEYKLQDFSPGWNRVWKERILASRGNRFRIFQDGGSNALLLDSNRSASGFWHRLEVSDPSAGKFSWSWKVKRSLTENHKEREKKGDDYAARVFVVFEPHFLNWKTKSICYVWAGNERVGSIYPNAYSNHVATIVLQSGDASAGRWISEERDILSDYRTFFGTNAKRISAVAVMVDTDNTGAQTNAAFKDLKLFLAKKSDKP